MTGRSAWLAFGLLAAGCSPLPVSQPALAASAAPVTSAVANAPRGPAPPMVDGMHIQKGACPGEGCYFGRMQARKALDIYDAPGKSPAIVGRLAEGEWVDAVATEDRYAPLKGVVSSASTKFTPGGVVYRLGYEGEGCFDVWDNGPAATSWCDDSSGESDIAWQQTPPPADGSEGFWVQVKRATGPGGWLREPIDLRCIGLQDRDADCPPVK
jgi:hypothetical protein